MLTKKRVPAGTRLPPRPGTSPCWARTHWSHCPATTAWPASTPLAARTSSSAVGIMRTVCSSGCSSMWTASSCAMWCSSLESMASGKWTHTHTNLLALIDTHARHKADKEWKVVAMRKSNFHSPPPSSSPSHTPPLHPIQLISNSPSGILPPSLDPLPLPSRTPA